MKLGFFILGVLSLSTYVQYTQSIDFTLKGITGWLTGIKEEPIIKESFFDFDGTVILDNNNQGTITIKAWSLPKIALEAIKKAPEKDLEALAIVMDVHNNKATIMSSSKSTRSSIDYHLMVPFKTNITIKNKGRIKIKNVEGNISATSLENALTIRGAVGNVTARAQQEVNVSFLSLPLDTTVNATSLKGSITLAVPKDIHANVYAKTTYNMVLSDHYIMLNPITILLNKQTWNRLQREITGMIGNGGAHIFLNAYNGITITW